MNKKHYLNGRYVSDGELLISPWDLGFMRGFAVFDYLRTYNNKPFKLDTHIQRLLRSAELVNLKHDYNPEQLVSIVLNTLKENDFEEEKAIKIVLSGGISNSLYQTSKPTLMVIVDPLKVKEKEIYINGICVKTVNFVRFIPEAKTTNYIEAMRQNQNETQRNTYESIYCTNKQVHEGLTSNIFAVRGKKIYTPKNNILLGVTRGVLLEDLRDTLHIIEEDFNLNFLLNADEVFITSSGKEVVPVVYIDGIPIGCGHVGEMTKIVIKAFHDFVDSYY